MKALVLAGGSGTRLRPITHTSAKQLVPVANKPVLFYGLEAIRDAGITEVGIVVGDTEPAIRSAVGSGQAFGLEVTYIRQSAPLGLAHAVLVAREFLGEDDFVMYLGDNFIVGGITALVEEFRAARPDAHIMLTAVADPRQFGVAELDGAGELVGLEEKPEQPKSDLALVGVYLFTPAVHEAVAGAGAVGARRAGDHRGDPWLMRDGRKVTSTIISGYWKDTGNVADMLEVNRVGAGERRAGRGRAGGRGERADRPGGHRGRSQGHRVADRGAGHHRRRHRGDRLLYRPVYLGRRGLRDRRQRDRVLHRAGRGVDPRGPPDRGVPDRAPCRGDSGPPGAPRRTGWCSAITARSRSARKRGGCVRILVTGGAGFIGSHYVRTMLSGRVPRL